MSKIKYLFSRGFPIALLNEEIEFPVINNVFGDLVAIGGDLCPERLIAAYKNGIFPWYIDDDNLPHWFCPKMRMVLEPKSFKKSRSLSKAIRSNRYEISCDRDFETIMRNCAKPRKDEGESWISEEFIINYSKLHEIGIAHSIEARLNGEIVGGLYGLQIGRIFFGESMFAFAADASKIALAFLCETQPFGEIDFIDCQVASDHLRSLGAIDIKRESFLTQLAKSIPLSF
ncbi:leucyl/phenylalanyl-tRNA--protein transferase [Campylobacterota bacterium]|nr:leucyl/phenylalanyl-tRNA--protein transferase [Campylobacterota bacterium]